MLKKGITSILSIILVLGIGLVLIPENNLYAADKPGITDMLNPGKKELEDNINKDSEKFKEETFKDYKKDKAENQTSKAKEKAYATILFKNEDKNDTLMYYKAQTNAGAPTVEGKMEKATNDKAEGTKYASFLNSLYSWNLYKTYTNQAEVGGSIPIKGIKVLFGGFILLCMYLMSGIDKLLELFANLFDYLNIFQYIANEKGEIPEDNVFSFLNPVVHFFKQLTTVAKLVVAIFFGWVAFRLVTGTGRARARGHYFKTKFSKGIYAIIAIMFGAAFISGCFGMISDVLRSADGTATEAVEKIPSEIIVDNRQYIDNSLTKIKGKKGAEGTNNGYILNHDAEQGFPTTANAVETKIPSQKLVKYMNTNNDEEKAEKLNGKELMKRWTFSDSYTSNDISSMYNLAEGDGWAGIDKKARQTQFKLAPGADGVKLYGGKDTFSFDLKDISIESASLVGNTSFGQFLNAVKLGVLVIGITFVVTSLYLAIFTGLINALKDFIVNFSLSTIGVYQAFFGIIMTAAMTMLGIGLVLGLVSLYPGMVTALDASFTDKLNEDDQFSGVIKQTLQTVVTVVVLWFCSKLVFSIRKGVMTMVQEWFTRILEAMNPDGGMSPSTSADKRALNNAVDSNLYGQEKSEDAVDSMKNPVEAGKSGLNSLKDIKDKGQEKMQSLSSFMKDEDDDGIVNGNGSGKKSSQFSGSVKGGTSDADDSETQGEKLEEDIQNGISDLEKTSDKDVKNNLNDQEKRIGEATEAFETLNSKGDDLRDAKQEYERLQNSGASQEELDSAKARVDDAQNAYDKQLGVSQNASRGLARTGASIGDIAEGRAKSMEDYNSANEEIQQAESNLTDLKEERSDMEAFGASKEDLQSMDKRIAVAEDKVSIAKGKQKLAKDAYESNVSNPIAEKDARNDLISANQAQNDANREFKEAKEHGNITKSEYSNLQKAATSLGSDVDAFKETIDKDVEKGEMKRNGLNFMKNNGGKAFASSDYGVQNSELERADNQVSNLQNEVKGATTKSEKESLNKQLQQAQAHHANVKTASNAMETGAYVNDGINSQQQVVSQAYEKRMNAEKTLNALKSKTNQGKMVDREEMRAAESGYKQAYSGHQHSERVLSGLQALHAVGSKNVEPSQLQVMNQQNDDNLEDLYKHQQQFSDVKGTINTLNNGGKASPQQTSLLSTVQKRVKKSATQKAMKASKHYNDTLERLEQLKRDEKNGVPVRSKIMRETANLKQAEKAKNHAEQKQSFVDSQGVQIRRTGKAMTKNIADAQIKVKDSANKVTERKQDHQNILKSGGLSTKQLQDYKKQVIQDRQGSERNKQQFIRERASRIDEMRKALSTN